MKKYLSIIGMVFVVAFLGGQAQARTVVFAEKHIRATKTAKSFIMPARRGQLYMTVWNEGSRIYQRFYSDDGCNASWDDYTLGIHVYGEVINCDGVSRRPFRITYLSTKRPNKFVIKFSNSPILKWNY